MSLIVIFGLGYVGTVTAACLAREGHSVLGVDVNPFKLDLIRRGRSPIVEDGLDELIAEATGSTPVRSTILRSLKKFFQRFALAGAFG